MIVDFYFVGKLYSIRTLRVGSFVFEDVERFFKLFHIEPFFFIANGSQESTEDGHACGRARRAVVLT